ncbi:hypothetical protein Mnod_4988 [Methylobacterium nodulans ORS 2060]|uniref:Uncharacterized protein n=1 Tax=Methylobacterium nodulans (strain LMG 21967 / CNCM I-2342 / ORS 2060) TaxID=460265 RepID=B8IIG8_METNO|nr:hypothetical protein Mnod_4988 [Methylobacterium nodulans ORS 2060]
MRSNLDPEDPLPAGFRLSCIRTARAVPVSVETATALQLSM